MSTATETRSAIVTPHEVCAMLGVSRSTLWKMEKLGRFPPSGRLLPRRRAWLRTTVEQWLEDFGAGRLDWQQ